jgi:hypothetical protein
VLLIVVWVTLIWPLNIPLMALAFKVRLGRNPNPFEDPWDFWFRSGLASLGLFGMTLVVLLLEWVLIMGAELDTVRGPINLTLLLLYAPPAVAFLFWSFALDDFLDAITIFLLYLMLPGLPLALVAWLLGLFPRLNVIMPWSS